MKAFVPLTAAVLGLLICVGCGVPNPAVSSASASSSGSTAAERVVVSVAAPLSSASVPTTFAVAAKANSSKSIAGWEIDIDGVPAYSAGAGSSINAAVTTTAGSHQVVVKAWQANDVTGFQTVSVTATASSTGSGSGSGSGSGTGANGLPTPPADAVVFDNIQQMTTGWGNCGTTACAGGGGSGTFWQAFNQTTPSVSGSSMELYNSGTYDNALWWRHLGAQDSATNLLWDFQMQLDDAAATYTQALEYDLYQFLDGYNYMVGTQCDYPKQVWDTYDAANSRWVVTSIPCTKFSANTWHHIQWYVTTDHTAHTYTYVTLVVDGKSTPVNQTYSARYNGWNHDVGVQWQLDTNSKGGGYHEWVDQATFTVW